MPRLPMISTLIVGLAVAAMIALGLWQLRRADEKHRLLARYEDAGNLPSIIFPAVPADDRWLYRRASGLCLTVTGMAARAGANKAGETGYRHIASCLPGRGEVPGETGRVVPPMAVDIGWSRAPSGVTWKGGVVSGVIGPDRDHGLVLVSDAAAPGLEPSATPSAANIPDNHVGYAIQWFAFALTAVVIYAFALRRRQVASATNQG